MIKRINVINNVGTFREFPNGGSVQFEQLTFIYGLNTKGKTTLTKILTSLKENEPSIIKDRKSIPAVNSGQSVKLSIRPTHASSELQCIFSNDAWRQRNSSDHLHIFGSDFIHRNLFTGLTIQRQNRENFTRFILGEQGVHLATQIADDKRLLRQKRSALPSLLPPYLRDKQEQEYVPFLTTDSSSINLEETKQQLTELKLKLNQEEQRLQRPTEILSIEEVHQLTIPPSRIEELISQTNNLLRREFNEISSAAITRLQEHIENTFEATQDAEQWIRKGLDTRQPDSQNCSFCGQSLKNATDLFTAYESFFNEAYREYMSDVSATIKNIKIQWQELKFDSLNAISTKQALLQTISSADK
jgi:wobble nucleotide-excising tRNase